MSALAGVLLQDFWEPFGLIVCSPQHEPAVGHTELFASEGTLDKKPNKQIAWALRLLIYCTGGFFLVALAGRYLGLRQKDYHHPSLRAGRFSGNG
eukprot:4994464-Amphidinium_carterae.1